MYENTFLSKRFQHTPDFFQKNTSKDSDKVRDLGIETPFSKIMRVLGRNLKTTKGEDFEVVIRCVI